MAQILEEPQTGFHLAITGATFSLDVFDYVRVSAVLSRVLAEIRPPEALKDRYNLESVSENGVQILEAIGQRRGFLLKRRPIDVGEGRPPSVRDFVKGCCQALLPRSSSGFVRNMCLSFIFQQGN